MWCLVQSEFIKYLHMVKDLMQSSSGLSGAIYTEVTDVEDEVNGLYTYDRQVQHCLKLNLYISQFNSCPAGSKVPAFIGCGGHSPRPRYKYLLGSSWASFTHIVSPCVSLKSRSVKPWPRQLTVPGA